MVEEGRSFPTRTTLTLLLGGGAVLLVGALACGVALLAGKLRARAAPPDEPPPEPAWRPEP